MTKAERIIEAIKVLLVTVPGAKIERNTAVPEKIPAGGLIVLRDGDPGDPDTALGKTAVPLLTKGKSAYIEAADQTWHEVSIELWTDKDHLVNDLNLIWDYANQFYSATCAVCHRAHDPAEFLANQWMGQLKAMKQHAPMDKEQYRLIQTYLQMHAGDTGGKDKH